MSKGGFYSMTNFLELIQKRESCRRYAQRLVEREKITTCLKAARVAPSACNSQPWHYTLTDDPKLTAQIAKAVQGVGINKFAEQVPAFAVVTEEKAKLLGRIEERVDSQTYAQMDIGLSVAHFVLAAAEQGLGTCILGWYDEKAIKEILNIPAERKVRLVLCIGYPADETPRQKIRKPLDEIANWVESRG
jgi:nitroreductase